MFSIAILLIPNIIPPSYSKNPLLLASIHGNLLEERVFFAAGAGPAGPEGLTSIRGKGRVIRHDGRELVLDGVIRGYWMQDHGADGICRLGAVDLLYCTRSVNACGCGCE